MGLAVNLKREYKNNNNNYNFIIVSQKKSS